jgi:hypothetical protein
MADLRRESNNDRWQSACQELLAKACTYSNMVGVHQDNHSITWKLNAYGHILKRQILLFQICPDKKEAYLLLQAPARGATNWPFLIIGELIEANKCLPEKTFLPSRKSFSGKVVVPMFANENHSNSHSHQAEACTPPSFLDPSASFQHLASELEGSYQYRVTGNIDALTVLTTCLVTMAHTLKPARGEDIGSLNPCGPPNIQLHVTQTGATHAANCRSSVRLWTNEKEDSYSAIWSSTHNINAGDCNALHLPSHFFGTATVQALRSVHSNPSKIHRNPIPLMSTNTPFCTFIEPIVPLFTASSWW